MTNLIKKFQIVKMKNQDEKFFQIEFVIKNKADK
jgi:hypothetical protein